jgi:hypothetical protein
VAALRVYRERFRSNAKPDDPVLVIRSADGTAQAARPTCYAGT